MAVLGGGPGGLLAALLAKRGDPGREVTVFERNRAGDTFGFGVVFSDADEVRIVDADGRDLPDGQPGALLTRGPYTPRGYYRAPEQNARAFTPDGWYASGDVVRRRPDGNLVVEGRDKDMINRGGEKISAEEVEKLLYRMPGIAQVAAVAAPDAELGERICVFVVPEPGQDITLDAISGGMAAAGVAKFKWPEQLELA